MDLSSRLESTHSALLRAVLLDCRPYIVNRSSYDNLHKQLNIVTYGELIQSFKTLNSLLVVGPVPLVYLGFDLSTPYGIKCARQYFGLFSRLEGSQVPSGLSSWISRVSQSRARLYSSSDILFCKELIFKLIGRAPTLLSLVPRHGPGSVSTGEKVHQKMNFSRMYTSLVPHGGSSLVSLNRRHDHSSETLELLRFGITKVIEVPKDMSKNRVISCEPLELQFLQQGIMSELMRRLRHSNIHFKDQSINQLHSRLLSNATLDMSNASDTVSRMIVKQIFPADWYELLEATRSSFARTPSGALVPLRCFSPMGSAVCFPVEALVFYTIARLVAHRSRCSSRSIHVYGDDIIVPLSMAGDLIDYLCESGFEPNVSKCCYRTPFRESCGAEWFDSCDVSITRVKRFSSSRRDNFSMRDYQVKLHNSGFENASVYIGTLLRIRTVDRPYRVRWNKDIQQYEALVDSLCSKCSTSRVNGYSAVFGWFTNRWSDERELPSHQFLIKRKWVLYVGFHPTHGVSPTALQSKD